MMRFLLILIVFSITAAIDGFHCTIPKLQVSELSRNKSLPDTPFIFLDNPDRQARLIARSTRDYLIGQYGATEVTLSSSNTYSHGKFVSTLEDYIKLSVDTSSRFANETFYLFGNNYNGIWSELTDLYSNPPCFGCDIAGMKTIGIGGEASGVSFHFHGPGFSESIIGTKRWFLFPPELTSIVAQFNPNMTVAQWVDTVYPELLKLRENGYGDSGSSVVDNNSEPQVLFEPPLDAPVEYEFYSPTTTVHSPLSHALNATSLLVLSQHLQECTIQPGEILYFPPMWMHATLNLDAYNVFMSLFIDPQLIK